MTKASFSSLSFKSGKAVKRFWASYCSMTNVMLILFLSFIFLPSCEKIVSDSEEKFSVVAQVGNSKLTEKKLRELFENDFSGEDSIRVVNAYINRWVKEELIKKEADKELQNDPDIRRAVEEYRKSLLIHKYEEELVKEMLDSTITKEQIARQYQKNKASFILTQPIFKVRWIIITSSNISAKNLQAHWKEDKSRTDEKWIGLAELYANNYNLDPNIWWGKGELLSLLSPKIEEEDLKVSEDVHLISLSDDDLLLLDVIDSKERGKLAPISFVEDDIRSYILHQRKESFLKKYRQKLFEDGVNSNNVKIDLR
jgi:hypothetical protein